MGNFVEKVKVPSLEETIKSKDAYKIIDYLERVGNNVDKDTIKKLEDAIIATNDIVQIYEFTFLAVDMEIKDFDLERFEQEIINSKNPKLMCYCIAFVPGINQEKIAKALYETKNAKYIELLSSEEYKESFDVTGDLTYKRALEEAKSFEYFPESLKEFKSTDVEELREKVLASKNPYYITELSNYIEYLNEYKSKDIKIDDLVSAQVELRDPMETYEFLASVTDLDSQKDALIKSVVDSQQVKFMYYVYEYVPNLTKEQKALLEGKIKEHDKNGKYIDRIETNFSNKEKEKE